ncbi:MAG: amidase family protein [Phycisphaerales bacterium]
MRLRTVACALSIRKRSTPAGRSAAKIVEVELPVFKSGIAAYYLICAAEASSNLARFDGVRYGSRASVAPSQGLEAMYKESRSRGFGPEVQRRIMLGTHVLSSGYYDAYYLTAAKARRLIKDAFDAVFRSRGCHVLLTPAAPEPAFRIGEKSDDPLTMYLEDLFTVPANLAGVPAITVPAGVVIEGGVALPVGVQFHAAALEEDTLLRAARMFEREVGFDAQPPADAATG